MIRRTSTTFRKCDVNVGMHTSETCLGAMPAIPKNPNQRFDVPTMPDKRRGALRKHGDASSCGRDTVSEPLDLFLVGLPLSSALATPHAVSRRSYCSRAPHAFCTARL
jgi:hypothetical protein